MSDEFKYWAFISYSQRDVKWAVWLHKTLETYRVPSWLRGSSGPDGPIPSRLYPIFRDNDELPGAADLGAAIHKALANSRYLIVICSPRSAASQWVNKEILGFQTLGRSDRILCFIVDGEPNAKPDSGLPECFPPAMRGNREPSGTSAPVLEPLAPDARKGRDSRHKASVRLLAGLLGVDFDLLWRRELRRTLHRDLRNAVATLAIVSAAALTYLAVADNGIVLPGGESVRVLLDRHSASVFRPVRSDNDVAMATLTAHDALVERLRREWVAGSWNYTNAKRTKGPKVAISPWVSSQAMSAVFRALGAKVNQWPEFWNALAAPFAKDLLIEADGKTFGWLVGDSDYPQAEPALWTVAALAVALGQRDMADDRRKQLLSWLDYAQAAADTYRPTGDGGWNILPQQDDPAQHTTYTTALALLAMLEVRRSGLGWHGDRARLEAMLRATTKWLAGEFDETSSPSGWRLHLNDTGGANTGEIADGLTLQIYSELLRAEEETNIEVSEQILSAIPQHLDRLIGRPANYAAAQGVIARGFTNFDGTTLIRTVPESYLWHPWAIECVVRWLRRLERTGGSAEAMTRTRRVLGYLTIDVGSNLFSAAASKAPTFVASETLYSLATVLPPQR